MASIPSIATIPSGYKATKLYSVLPVDGSADLTFARAGSATRVASNGIIETMATDVPRLDYYDGGCPSLLLEPQSTNLAEYSEDISNAVWAKTNASITSNSILAPDGTLTADTLTATANSGQIQQVYSGSSATEYTASFWIKRKTGSGVVNIRSVENANTPVTITDEWTRVSLAVTSTSTTIRIGLNLATSGDEVYVWGAQLEQLGYATSYIANLTTGSSTRVAESMSKTGLSDYIDSTKGTLFCNFKANATDATLREINLSDGTFSNALRLNYAGNADTITFFYRIGGVTEASIQASSVTLTDYNKVAITWDGVNMEMYLNGVSVGTNSATTPFSSGTLTKVNFARETTSDLFESNIKDFRLYKQVLSTSELTSLTS